MALGSHYLDPDLQAFGIFVDSTDVKVVEGPSWPASSSPLLTGRGHLPSLSPAVCRAWCMEYVSEVGEWVGPMDRSRWLSVIYSPQCQVVCRDAVLWLCVPVTLGFCSWRMSLVFQ